MSPLKIYHKLLKTHFLLVQSVQTGVLMAVGDCLAQKVVEKKPWKDYNVRRTTEFFGIGACLVAPTVTLWYRVLYRKFGTEQTLKATIQKVATDQLLFAPVFLAVFITCVNLLHNKDREYIRKEFETKYVDIVLTNWKIWPTAQIINFYFIPVIYQVLYAQCVAVFWNTYLTWKTSQKRVDM